MKKTITLLFIATLFSLKLSAQCNPAIPSSAIVVATSQTVTGSYKVYWVCSGATVTGSSSYCDYYLEPGATLAGNGGYATIYVPAGATVNRSGGSYADVYYVNAGDVVNPGGSTGLSMNPCASITYDYANAPSPGCPTCTKAGTAATSISSSSGSAICQGKPSTLTQVGGTLGPNAQWKWYTGSCGGTLIDSGAAIVVAPSSTTTYFLRAEDSCSTPCVQITLSPTSISIPVIAGDPTPLCAGQSTTLSIINNPCFGNCYYIWSSGDSGISIVVSPSSATTYTATVKNDCGDSTSSTITIPNCATGMALYSVTHGINIAPNPSHGRFTLSMPAGLEAASVRIFDLLGNEIPFTETRRSGNGYRSDISIGKKPSGIYFVRIAENGNEYVVKLVIDSE